MSTFFSICLIKCSHNSPSLDNITTHPTTTPLMAAITSENCHWVNASFAFSVLVTMITVTTTTPPHTIPPPITTDLATPDEI
jgi:hypothetical protein